LPALDVPTIDFVEDFAGYEIIKVWRNILIDM
jgi:hypothetical protein